MAGQQYACWCCWASAIPPRPAPITDYSAWGIPTRLNVATLGRPAFHDDFSTLSVGVDQASTAGNHRWRQVLGSGGPCSWANRDAGGSAVYVDKDFAGLTPGPKTAACQNTGLVPGPAALGLNSISWSPGRLGINCKPTPGRFAALLDGRPWVCGVLTTKFSYHQRYGTWVAVLNPPDGWGTFFAFWLYGETTKNEIDVFEELGGGPLYQSFHAAKNNGTGIAGGVTTKFTPPAEARRFHTYALSVFPPANGHGAAAAWYVDGALTLAQPLGPEYETDDLYVILNGAMGGSWGLSATGKGIQPGDAGELMLVTDVAIYPTTPR